MSTSYECVGYCTDCYGREERVRLPSIERVREWVAGYLGGTGVRKVVVWRLGWPHRRGQRRQKVAVVTSENREWLWLNR